MIHFNDDLGLFGRFSGQDMSERDPESLRESYDAFKVVVDKYPQSKYAPDAAQRMRYIVNALASHEVHAADYYYRRGAYVAAINRAQLAIREYKNAPATEDALHIMMLSYGKLDQPQLAGDTKRVLAARSRTARMSPASRGRARKTNRGGRSGKRFFTLTTATKRLQRTTGEGRDAVQSSLAKKPRSFRARLFYWASLSQVEPGCR